MAHHPGGSSSGSGAALAAGFVPRGALVCEYGGQLIAGGEARRREAAYAACEALGSYMFYFEHGGTTHCVDATAERREYGVGRLANHSRRAPNCLVRKAIVDGVPRLALLANRDIAYGEEIKYDYGERDKGACGAFAWLTQS